jgi:hypothetical protein
MPNFAVERTRLSAATGERARFFHILRDTTGVDSGPVYCLPAGQAARSSLSAAPRRRHLFPLNEITARSPPRGSTMRRATTSGECRL